MKLTTLTIMITFFLSCKEEPKVIPDQEIQAFFSDINILTKSENDGFVLYEEPLVVDSILSNSARLSAIIDKEGLLNEDDKRFMHKQLLNNAAIWTKDQISRNKIVTQHYIDSIGSPQPSLNTPTHINISLPYFSKNRRFCLLYYDFYCGNLCANTAIRLYEKKQNKWVIVKTYFQIVS